jgi:hypothetical protein
VFAGGYTGSAISNVVDYVTIASAGNATEFGDLVVGVWETSATSSSIRGVFGGGNVLASQNVIQYITIASTGNALDFGDLIATNKALTACSNAHGGL